MILVVTKFVHPARIIEDPQVRVSINLGLMYGDNLIASYTMKYYDNTLPFSVRKWMDKENRRLPGWIYVDI